MSFHEIQFPPHISFGSAGGPELKTEIVALANGYEERNSAWAQPRRRYDAGIGLRGLADLSQVLAFFEARRGRLYGFRWKDWGDYRSGSVTQAPSAQDQLLGIGSGIETKWQLVKNYTSGPATHARPIKKPILGSVQIAIQAVEQRENVDFTVDYTQGTVTFTTPPPAGLEITAGYEFDVPVRFDSDFLPLSIESFNAGQIPNIAIIEVRL